MIWTVDASVARFWEPVYNVWRLVGGGFALPTYRTIKIRAGFLSLSVAEHIGSDHRVRQGNGSAFLG